jgi:ATP-dependent Clp protease adaptor protein ClpS|tara:strand:- start:315 stop:626 length:312 start_codon:yes stop_codon:yes gene_type:complete
MSTEFVNDVQIDEVVKKKAEEPLRYKVVLLNDDQTPVEWVIKVLVDIFKHTNDTAEKITLTIHNEGSGIAGIYTYEIAEQKTIEATTESRNHGFPLQIKLEEE